VLTCVASALCISQSDDDEDEDDAAAFEAYKAQRIAFVQNSLSVTRRDAACVMRFVLPAHPRSRSSAAC
jgi:hypothetical protein